MYTFQNDASAKTQIQERLEQAIAEGRIDVGPTAWDGTRGSVAGIVGQGDATAFAVATGTPACMAGLLDMLVQNCAAEPAFALDLARNWIAAIPVGAEASGVPSALVVHLLRDDAFLNALATDADGMGASHALITALHERTAAGAVLERREWSAARAAAVAAADAAADDSLVAIGRLLEAAAWPPLTSRILLTDVLQAWFAARELVGRMSPPWSVQLDMLAKQTLQRLVAEHQSDLQSGRADLFALFAAHDPELANGFRVNQVRSQERGQLMIRECAALAIAELSNIASEERRVVTL